MQRRGEGRKLYALFPNVGERGPLLSWVLSTETVRGKQEGTTEMGPAVVQSQGSQNGCTGWELLVFSFEPE